MLVTAAHRTTPTAKAALAKMPQVEVLTASMAARTPRTAAMVHNHPYERAVTPALPAPEYYGGSAQPPPPSADVAPIHLCPPEQQPGTERTWAVPTFTDVRSTGQAPGFTSAASPRLRRSHFAVASQPRLSIPGQEFPALHEESGCALRTGPNPPGESWAAHQASPVDLYPGVYAPQVPNVP
jgi:hypothetical protein